MTIYSTILFSLLFVCNIYSMVGNDFALNQPFFEEELKQVVIDIKEEYDEKTKEDINNIADLLPLKDLEKAYLWATKSQEVLQDIVNNIKKYCGGKKYINGVATLKVAKSDKFTNRLKNFSFKKLTAAQIIKDLAFFVTNGADIDERFIINASTGKLNTTETAMRFLPYLKGYGADIEIKGYNVDDTKQVLIINDFKYRSLFNYHNYHRLYSAEEGCNLLDLAVLFDNEQLLEYLIANGAHIYDNSRHCFDTVVNGKRETGFSPLKYVLEKGDISTAKTLLGYVNLGNSLFSRNVLKRPEFFTLLLSTYLFRKAENAKTSDSSYEAIKKEIALLTLSLPLEDQMAFVAALNRNIGDITNHFKNMVAYSTVMRNMIDGNVVMENAFNKHLNPFAFDQKEMTNLLAALFASIDLVPDIDIHDYDNFLRYVRFLVFQGAYIDIYFSHQNIHITPLHKAVSEQNKEIVETLLNLGANPDMPTSKGFRPLHLAVEAQDAEIAKVLLKKKPDLSILEAEDKGFINKLFLMGAIIAADPIKKSRGG